MKYLVTISILLFAVTFANAQYSADKTYNYTVSFEKNAFENEDAKEIVRSFRKHVFTSLGEKCDFTTRFDETGMIYFKTELPVDENIVAAFFKNRNKSYYSFEQVIEKPRLYAFEQ